MKRNRDHGATPEEAGDDAGHFRIGGRILAGFTLGFLLVAGAGGWAATAQLRGAVIATGTVNVDRNLKAVQHRDGGIIKSIEIKEGDKVAAGRILLTLDDAQTRAELAIVGAQLAEATVRRARLVAERDGLETLEVTDFGFAKTSHLSTLLAGEMRLLDGNLNNRGSRKEQLSLGIDQLGEEIKGLEAQRAFKVDEIGLVSVEHKKMKGLADKRLVEGSRVHTADRDMARMAGEKAEIDAEIARARAKISEIKLQVIAIDEEARTEAQRELSGDRAEDRRTRRAPRRHRGPAVAYGYPRPHRRHRQRSRRQHDRRRHHAGRDACHHRAQGRPAQGRGATVADRYRPGASRPAGQAALLRLQPAHHAGTHRRRHLPVGGDGFDKASGESYYLAEIGVPADEIAKLDQNRLAEQPDVLAYGQDFEVELEDKQGRLPEDVRLWFWFDGDDESAARPQRMTFAGGKMTHRLSSITKPFRYRAVGGDDRDMSWIALRVVEPPKIVESRITVQPPAYTGRPAETAERRIRALAGSTVAIQLRVDRPVAAASLSFLSQHVQQKIPAQVATDGRNLKLSEVDGHSWTLTTSGSYGWELTDRDGVTVTIGDNTEVDVIPDLPPVVSLESPATDSAFTARAMVPIRGSVEDDLAIHRIEFHSGETTEVLAEFVAPRATDSTQKPDEHSQHLVEYAWDLARLAELKPGTSLPFEIVAADFRPQTSLPASGTISNSVRSGISATSRRRPKALLKQLNEALRLQRILHRQTGSLVTQLQSTKVLSAADSAVWPSLEPGQRRVTAVLAGEGGARPRVDQLLRELSANRWDVPELVAHLATIQRELGRITEKLLPPVQQRLSQADRSLRFESAGDSCRDSGLDRGCRGTGSSRDSAGIARRPTRPVGPLSQSEPGSPSGLGRTRHRRPGNPRFADRRARSVTTVRRRSGALGTVRAKAQ